MTYLFLYSSSKEIVNIKQISSMAGNTSSFSSRRKRKENLRVILCCGLVCHPARLQLRGAFGVFLCVLCSWFALKFRKQFFGANRSLPICAGSLFKIARNFIFTSLAPLYCGFSRDTKRFPQNCIMSHFRCLPLVSKAAHSWAVC